MLTKQPSSVYSNSVRLGEIKKWDKNRKEYNKIDRNKIKYKELIEKEIKNKRITTYPSKLLKVLVT